MLKNYINSSVQWHFMRKQNRVALLLILPIAVFLWFIGWSLYWIGSSGKVAKPRKIPDSWLTFTVLMPEQKYAK
jgi:hypothetical protein